ncbi:MAG TPA: EAL domain-containing protein [Candidatus Caenarcaniphilales bacterium]|nr:EAL domain-containing protein [Candidatus Caenarcaniphilales bacterium]
MRQRDALASEAELLDELGRALDRGEFRLEYQPVVRLGSAAVAGAEALIRWRHPRRGTLSPGEFLPLAERSGLIAAIGAYALEEACRAAASWVRPTNRATFVSVNVSPIQLAAPGADETLLAAVRSSGLAPTALVLELTGGVGIDAEPLSGTLAALREAGVRLALDDFGSATSLRDLKQLTVDFVKLDREFVVEIDGPPEEAAFALAVLNVASARGIEVVAKGVESREQAWRLAELGCRYGQGYFFSKPLGATGMVAVLRQGTLRA